MNKKGFTLIEILAVIIVLGVVFAIAIPAVNNVMENAKQQVFIENEKKLTSAVETYYANNYVPINKINDSLFVSLKDLKANHIVENIYDPKDNSACDEIESGVVITKVNTNKYNYVPYLKCANYTSSSNNNIVESINHAYDSGTGKYSINVSVTENPLNLKEITTDTYKIGYVKPTIIDYTEWVLGTTGSQGSFNDNGSASENEIILHPNPWGKTDVVWATLVNDIDSGADGGWTNYGHSIDNTKKYRLSVWIRREDVGDGRTYFGAQGPVAKISDSTQSDNPYFFSHYVASVPEIENHWLLYIAYIHPYDYALTTSDSTTGIYYGITKQKLIDMTDYKWLSTGTIGGHRSYLYYSTSINEHQYWYRPRFEVVDGTEPTIDELLAGTENPNVNDYDTISNSADVTFIVDNIGTYNFTMTRRDGTSHRFTYTIK